MYYSLKYVTSQIFLKLPGAAHLASQLRQQCLTSECQSSTPSSRFLANADSSRNWIPATYMGDPDQVYNSQLWPWPTFSNLRHLEIGPANDSSLSPSLPLSLCSFPSYNLKHNNNMKHCYIDSNPIRWSYRPFS